MNAAKRPGQPRNFTWMELGAIALLFIGIRVVSNHFANQLLAHFVC